MTILRYISLCLILLATGNVAGQGTVNKASRVEEKTFAKEISRVSVYGEKASVSVKGWSSTEVKVLLRPVSRNLDKEQAKDDLKYIQYYAEKEGDRLVIKNSFKGKLEQITSNLSMEIEVFMPASVPVEVTNLYGPVVISSIAGVTANVSFGSLSVTDISSMCSITARYSNIELTSAGGNIDIKSEKSDIRARALSATTTIDCSYGTADLEFTGTGLLLVKGYRTTVTVSVDEFEKHRYSLEARQGKVILPGSRQAGSGPLEINHPGTAGLIDLTTSYCNLTISTK